MFRAVVGVTLLAISLLSAGDRAAAAWWPAPSTAPATAEARRAAATALPPFARFGWVSPPVESTTHARLAEFAGAGLDLMLPAQSDPGRPEDNLARLDLAAGQGLRCLIWDRRFNRYATLEVNSAAGGALLDSLVATYRGHPAFGGYYLGDEPPRSAFRLLGQLHHALRARDPEHPAWNNLLSSPGVGGWSEWNSYVRDYLDSTGAAALSYDEYDFLATGDRGVYAQQLARAAAIANQYGIPFWVIMQLTQHGPYRAVSDGEIAWQVAMALAYGVRGLGYFTYWTPAPDPTIGWHEGMIALDGTRTHGYDVVAALNPRAAAAGMRLARMTRLATTHAGSVPAGCLAFAPSGWISAVEGRAALGFFADSIGTRHVLVVNADSASAQVLTLTLPGASGVWRLADDGASWLTLATAISPAGPRVSVHLSAGDFALLRVSGSGEPLRAGAGPALRLSPNPARGTLRFEFASVRERGHVELLDATGRRVWARELPHGSSTVLWDGSVDFGGRARPGIYFARAADAGGVSVVNAIWLGRP